MTDQDTMIEDKQIFPGFVGPSYQGRSKRFDDQRCVNLYCEIDESPGVGNPGKGKNQQNMVLIGTPGLEALQTIGSGPIRGLWTISNLELTIVVSGNEVYQIAGGTAIPVLISGNLNTSVGPVSIADNGIQVLIVDVYYGYSITIGTLVLNTISDPNFYPASTVTFQDGYFILNQTGTSNFFISDLYSVDWLPLNQSAKTGNSDILIGVISVNRQLYLLGARTLEIWWDAGASGSSPFQRQDGRFSQQGLAAPASLAILNETFYWLSSNAQGGGVVMTLQNAMPTRISTHAVEFSLQNAGNIAQATGYSYQEEGHYFYVLNVPGTNTTWVYDTATGLWAERQSSVNGVIGQHLGNCHAYLNGQHLIGDYTNGNLYQFNLDYFTDNGSMIPRIRQSPHVSMNNNNCFYSLMDVDLQFGVGLVNNGSNLDSDVNPMGTLEISRDGGKTWGNPIYGRMGAIGAYRTRCRFDRLGYGRGLTFRLTITGAVQVQILSAMLDLEMGDL